MVNTSILILILSITPLTNRLSGQEPTHVIKESSPSDVEALKGFSAINFFVVSSPTISSEKIESLLKGYSKVVSKKFSIQNPLKDGLFKNPFLTYEIMQITDMHGKALPLLKASLAFEASCRIEKSQQFFHSVLWNQSCYLQGDEKDISEKTILNTLNLLFANFCRDFQEANQEKPIRPTLYLAEL